MTQRPRIAIPVPHSSDHEYARRSLPQYENAIREAGGEPVRIELDQPADQVMKRVEDCAGVLLPGSGADVDPAKYGATRHEMSATPDAQRDSVDDLLLQDAFSKRKPILGICYGLQSLNVYLAGTLLQHIESPVDHSPEASPSSAHSVVIETGSTLANILRTEIKTEKARTDETIPVNSSHHQSADKVGRGLRVSARSTSDGVIEALEGTSPDHFVLAVQWHPERSVKQSPEVADSAKAIFRAFVNAAQSRKT